MYNLNLPLISIITVVYNDEKNIEKTILSIINQTYKNIEYIIIDGKSNDNTLNIINKYKEKIRCIISEKDNGIYDAMNKGIKISKGDYLWFINSGDQIYDFNTLEKIILNNNNYPDVFYGKNALYINDKLKKITNVPKNLKSYHFIFDMAVSHQAIIVKKELVDFFNLKYKYAADHDWIIKILKKSKYNKNTNLVLSKYLLGGLTSYKVIECWKERLDIIYKHFNIFAYFINLILFFKEFIKFKIKKILKKI